ncbi:MAG: ribbon-helix-helix domain-containing protein [Alphaproteobacteria bacterium]
MTNSRIHKRSVSLEGHRTSVSVEDEVWTLLGFFAEERGVSRASLIAQLDHERIARGFGPETGGLSTAIRLFVLHNLAERAGLAHLVSPDNTQ